MLLAIYAISLIIGVPRCQKLQMPA